MKGLLLKYWDRLRSSFWFVPATMASMAGALAVSSVALDKAVADEWLERLGWSYTGGATGAGLLLSTVAGSMIAIAGTVFSMTLVALSLASSQLGPRLLRNFMRDKANQVVLGTFVATFVYCLLVLGTIRRADEIGFVPHLSVSIGLLLAVVSIGVLIYFIHHVSTSIQADEVVAQVGEEIEAAIERLYPDHLGQADSGLSAVCRAADLPKGFEHEARRVLSPEDGYLQLVDADTLMTLATREDLLLRLECRPGNYLSKGMPIVMVWPGDRATADTVEKLNAAFVFGTQRSSAQDIEFSVSQLVEIAVRALSTGINDPFTAIACVNRIGSALCHLARRDMPSPLRYDSDFELRLVAPGATFAGIVGAAFDQIRQNARCNPAVAISMLDSIAHIAGNLQRKQDFACLERHAQMIIKGARDTLPEMEDLVAVESRFAAASCALREHGR